MPRSTRSFSIRNYLPGSVPGSPSPVSDASETGEDGESAENPQSLIPGESSLEDVIDSAGLEARDAVDAMSECFGQQGLIRTSEEQDKEEDVMADASDYGDNADIPLVGRISNNAEEEENKSAFLCDLYYSVKSAEDAYVLKPGANLEYLLKICKFSPEELLDIRQKLQDMSYDEQYMSREPDKSAEYLPGYETAKAECKDLIIKQLYKFFHEAVRREATGFEAGERDMDHSPQDEVTDDEEMSESAWLSKLYDDMQWAENPLEAGERLELAIETCRFSPNELPDIRQRLQNLSSDQPNETGEHNPRAEDRPAHKQAYAECEALIMEQLSRQIQESLQREEAAQAAEQDSVPPKTPANGGHISWASEKTDGAGEDLDNPPESEKRESSDSLGEDVVNSSADENDSVEIARLRNLLNTAQSTGNFEPGESLDEMIEGCSFPPKEYFDIKRIHGLFVAKPHSVGDDNELAEYQSSQEIAKAEFRELMITQLRRRVVEAVRNRKVTSSAGTVQPVTPSYVGLDISADSPDSPGGSPQATEDLGVVGGARPRGVTLVTRTWAAASTSFSSSYQKPVPQTTGSGLPLIMSLDGPVNIYQTPSSGEQKLAEERDQASKMGRLGLHKEIFELKQQLREQKLYYDEALRIDPAERLPAPQELYKAALKCFSQITIDTILARCLVMFFLGDYMKMDEHAVTALQIADNIRDKANCVRCYYISGVALWNQGEEHYDKAYEAFSSAKDCPGSYKISDRNAQDWKRIVNAALRQTPRRANYAPVTTTWADSYNNDFISALGRRNSARVPVDPELPTAAPPASRPWSEADFETANLRFQARHAASEPYDPRNLSDPAPPRPRPWSQREIMSAEFVDRARHAALEPNDPGNLPLPESLPSESDGTVRRVSLIDHTSMVNEPPTTTTTDRNPSAPSWSPHHKRNSPIAGASPFGSPPSHASRSPRTMHAAKSPLSFHSQTQAERDSQLGAFGISDEFSPVSGQSPNDASWQPYDQGGSPQLGGLNVRTMSEGATARWRETSAIMAREAKERYALENAMTVDRAAELGGLGFTPVFGMSPGLSPPGQMSAGFSLGSPALGPESPGSPENGSPDRLSPRDEHQRGRSVAFNSEVQAFSAPSSVAGSSLRPPSPASSVGSVRSVRSISSNRSRRPELLPITIPQPKARRTTIAFAKPAIPDRRPSGPIMSAVDGVGAGSIPRSAAGSYKGFGEGSMPRSAVGNFRGLIEGSYRSTIADQMLGNGTPLRSASVSPASAYFEGLVQNQFGGQGGEARDSPVDSPTQARGRGQGQGRGRGRGRGMQRVPSYSAGTAQRNVWAGYQKQMEEEAKKEGEGEGEGVESTDLDDELAKRTARAARYNFEESCERAQARGRRRGRGRGLVQMPPDPEDTVGEKNGFKFSDIARSMQDGGRRGFQRSGEEIAGEQHRRDEKWGSRPAEEPSISEEDEEEDGEENEEEGDEREKWEERRRRKKEEITREDSEEIESTVSNKDDFDYSRGSSNTDKNEDEGEGGKNGEE